jgi:hypothetical protein
MLRIVITILVLYAIVVGFVYLRQRSLLFFPTHLSVNSGLRPWTVAGQTIGYCREVAQPHAVWLMMHGNAGQAADRDYVLPCMSDRDALYVLEYPGYGSRAGSPSHDSINGAAAKAYEILRQQFPTKPVCVLGESVGSGPACALAGQPKPPDKIVLAVPYDNLVGVASEHFPFLPVRFMLRDRWDNVDALKNYKGPVEIFGAASDTIIPGAHARKLAAAVPGARFTEIPGGHNDWSMAPQVKIRWDK